MRVIAAETPSLPASTSKYLAEVFPGGIPRLDPQSLKDRPPHGMVLRTTSPKAAAIGLKAGDVIVAINDTRIANMDQYLLVIDSAPDSHFRFTAWNGHTYITCAADLPDHRLGVGSLSAASLS